ncbi:glycosyl transferase [Flavipsychrobacter stenotrophus]|uniref:Peptide O-xylosyltransferase n=1 Tax=Flavipsychrobacter stenotrophus TaxID=2077091 RepID=A0A2S7T1K4_9BACT|nr:beta-1,6-N-acetylglucosaminyltransferase [Flavipsychrobacter stenotrophus]PQJ13080.1 glycosyl transferase [Flavipsychrobacter stenotrophus]
MKLAHLILAHSNPDQLKRLVDKLAHSDSRIYIHLDKKTEITPFLPIADNDRVSFISNRIKVYWGGYSIVQATINSFEEILATGIAFDHINLLSGQDYPIKSTDHIHQFLAENKGKIFMHSLSVKNEWQEAIPRIERYHLANLKLPAGTYRMEQMVNAILPKRKMPEGIVAMGRSQWFTASKESIAYIVDYVKKEQWVSRFFKMSWAADELIFQTILFNSPFKEHMVNDNLLYVDWSEGKASPKLLTMEDAAALKASDKLFARKFNSEADSAVLDYIDNFTA